MNQEAMDFLRLSLGACAVGGILLLAVFAWELYLIWRGK